MPEASDIGCFDPQHAARTEEIKTGFQELWRAVHVLNDVAERDEIEEGLFTLKNLDATLVDLKTQLLSLGNCFGIGIHPNNLPATFGCYLKELPVSATDVKQ